MFYDAATSLLYILCGTNTNGDHYLYAYTTDGVQKCFITIPTAVGMTRVDGFYIKDTVAYIVDSQGPLYADTAEKLGGSLYKVDWATHPCGCDADGECSSTEVEWTPTVLTNWAIDPAEMTIGDGGGVDTTFRNSGVVVIGDYWYGVNGVHPINDLLNGSYPKSLIKVDMTTATTWPDGYVSVAQKWSFDASTWGYDVDMEALTCGPDECESYIYIGDEYNYIWKMDLTQTSPTLMDMWDLNEMVDEEVPPDGGHSDQPGVVPTDMGIESMTFDGTYFYIGIQYTQYVYKLTLTDSMGTSMSRSHGVVAVV